MRIHSLEVTAFGPFAETVSVDVDALGEDGLFLLHGRTGAGKTSLLDAIAFALYGTVPGERQNGRRLRSDHADPATPTTVVLEATISGRRIRLERSPKFERPKRRGTGTTEVPARATLVWLDGAGENLSRHTDVGDAVNGLVGMSADQFFQVVLLPQGEFAKFLVAESDERGALLEKLFDTTRFGSVETWFKQRRTDLRTEVEHAGRAVERLVERIGAVAGIETGAAVDRVEWARRLELEASDIRDRTCGALDDARAAHRDAVERLRAAEVATERRMRRVRAEADLAALDEQESRRTACLAEIDRARRAASVAARRAASIRTDRDLARAESEFASVLDAVRRHPVARDVADEVAAGRALETTIDEWTERITRAESVVRMRETVRRTTAELASVERSREESVRTVETETARVRDLRRELDAGAVRRDEARAAARALADLEEKATRAASVADAARRLAELDRARTDAADAAARTESEHLDARGVVLDLRERRLAGMASELAARLLDGDECPVCGARDHPRLAPAAPDAPNADDEERARRAEEHSAAVARTARDALGRIDRESDVLRERCAGVGVREADDRLRAARAAVDAATDAAREVERIERRMMRLSSDIDAADAAVRRAERAVATADERRTALARALDDAQGALEEAGDDPTIDPDETVRLHRSAISVVRDADPVRVRVEIARSTQRAAREDVESAAREAGFADGADAARAERTPDRLGKLDSAVRDHDDRAAAARSVLADPDIAAAEEGEPVAEVRRLVDERVAARESARASAQEAERRVDAIARHRERLEDAHRLWAPLRARFDELDELTDLLAGGGRNARRMSLRSYVLAARLEEVAESASVRLRRMSGGRYHFVHSDAVGPHGRRGGLGLDVYDEYTGVVRSARTLSGGETFQASLALALGLADVVSAESGGVTLDTIFIDEGFGSLDAESLDAVMGVLDELRAGGRVVGVVSHVDEMRQRIPSRLHVVHGRDGSRLELHALGTPDDAAC